MMADNGWAAENIAFGMGGGLLQMVNRDTCKWAMKMSAIKISGEWRDVYKSPKGATWKASKKGQLDLSIDEDGKYFTWSKSEEGITCYGNADQLFKPHKSALVTYHDPELGVRFKSNLAQIRNRAAL